VATLIVPCAGSGTRLNQPGLPKALTPFGGTTLLGHILGRISHTFGRIIVVIRPADAPVFVRAIRDHAIPELLQKTGFAFQDAARGSLDAVMCGIEAMDQADRAVVVWGDQVGVSADAVAQVLDGLSAADVVVPALEMARPYVWIEMTDGLMVKVGRQRDGDSVPATGLADLGVFGLSPAAQAFLPACVQRLCGSGADRELDFTYAIPCLGNALVAKVILRTDLDEAIAVNSPQDLERALERFGMTHAS
jgi:CTP:molybdopterin cytidylyltransferase MocA